MSQKTKQGTLPPGPLGLPLLGNALQIPLEYSWITFARWAQTYGGVMHISVFRRSFVILSSRAAILDLLEKRGAIYSDRPVSPMVGELAGYALYTIMLPYGPRHKAGRKLLLSALNQRNEQILHRIQEEAMSLFTTKLAEDPLNTELHIRWLVASIILRITYGLTVKRLDDPVIDVMERVVGNFSTLSTPGAYLVDSFPTLMHVPEWFPGGGFKKVARNARALVLDAENKLYNTVKEQVACGTAPPSFIGDFIQGNPNATLEEELLFKQLGILFYAVGSDTTASAIESFLILMAQHPDIQQKAQAELDSLTRRIRSPKSTDRADMPYLNAVLWEVFRYNPTGPLAIPHKVRQDDYYAGYWIPSGSTVIANTWAIMRDPAVYPNPDEVNPERYMDGTDDTRNPDPRPFAFGYGRRTCPGQMLAEDIIFLAAANVLAYFDISDAYSTDGSKPKWGGGIVSRPVPFKCALKSRTKASRDAMNAPS